MSVRGVLFTAAGAAALLASPAFLAFPAWAQAPDAEAVEVVVTAAPYPVSINSATTSIDIVTRAALDTAVPAGIGDMLSGLPGLRSTNYGPGASRPIIRGLSGPRVLILQNGVGLVDASALSPDHAVASEPGEASRIEVLRGPSTLAYGGSGIGGVGNLIDDRTPSTPATHGAEGRVSASYGTGDDSRALSGGVKAGSGPWVVALDAVRRRSDDYAVPVDPVSGRLAAAAGLIPAGDRKVLNSGVDMTAYGGGISYVGAGGFLGVSIKRTLTDYGIPYAQVVPVGPPDPDAEGPVTIDLKQTRIDIKGEHALAFGPFDQARLQIGWADYRHAEIDAATGGIGTQFLSSGAEGRLELVQGEHDGWQGAVGFQGLGRRLSALGDEAFIPSTAVREGGIFTLQRFDSGVWGVEGGLRVDRRSLTADGLAARPTSAAAAAYGVDWRTGPDSRRFTNLSASGAVFYRPTKDWFVSVSVAHNSRAPTEFELFADGPHPGTGGYELGDPTLGKETVTSVEATLRYTGMRGRAEAHLYKADYSSFIDEVRTGAVEDGLPVYQFRRTGADFVGAEVEGSYPVWRGGGRSLSLEGAYDWVRADTDRGVPARIPPWSLTGRAVFESVHVDAQVEVRHVAAQDRIAPLELPTGAYTTVEARVSYKPFHERAVKLFLEGRNLTNQEAREHASFLKDIAPLPGRTVRVGAAYSF